MSKDRTINSLRRSGHFTFWSPMPATENREKAKAELRLAFQRHLDKYFSGNSNPPKEERRGPQSY